MEFLKTKLFIPRPRGNLVSRPRLIERLNAGLNHKLTLIAAPAGFGKTTLLSEWIPQSPRDVTWLSLDSGDNDPTRFWAYFISSLQQLHPDLGARALALIRSSQAPAINSILTVLINDIISFQDQFSIVLDDYHTLVLHPIHDALSFLINNLPANMNLILTTRANPLLPLARLRARNTLAELRANDLRFTVEEAAEFLTRSMSLNLSAEEVAILEQRTEGWIAGLQIAGLSIQGREVAQDFIRTFSGSHRHIVGYLASEVLDQRPKGTLNFLLKTSILDLLCGDLCDAVTGDSGGQAILESLEHANLFITALDDEGVWYRYNQLFAEVLQLRLKRTWPDRVAELHTRARIWYERQGMIEEAVSHALAGAEYEAASRLIEAVAGGLLRRGASASLDVWLDALPEETIRIRPRLCLVRGWTYFIGTGLNLERAEAWAQLALQVAKTDGPLDPGLTGEAATLQAMIAATRSEVTRSLELLRYALNYLPLDNPWRSAAVFCLGTAHYLSGDISAAGPVFDESMRLSRADGDHYIELASASFFAEILMFQGRLSQARNMYAQVLARVDPELPQKGSVMAHGGLASILYERNELEAALAHIQLGLDQVERVGGAWSAYMLYRVLARIHHARGQWAGALDALERIYQIAQSTRVDLVMALAAALRARLQIAQGDFAAAETWAEKSGLNPEDAEADHPGWHEVEYLSLARLLAVQGRQAEALSLLGRLLKAAEVDGRFGSVIAILILQSLVFREPGRMELALERLERALILAEPEGYVRVFVDEGDPMHRLLSDFQSVIRHRLREVVDSVSLRQLAYTDKLLAEFPPSSPQSTPDHGITIEPLSERELDILRLIATGRTNQEIAEILVIAVSTVKSHINSLYGKLGANRRTQAIAIAREMGVLAGRNPSPT